MSDTTTHDDARQAPPIPHDAEPPPETRTDDTAPGADDTPQDDTPKPAESKPDPRDRAIRQMAFENRETRRQLQQLREQHERANPPDPNAPPSQADLERIIEERAQARIEQRESQERREAWIARGKTEHADFDQRCNQLAEMGVADNRAFMDAIDRLPDAHKVVANLAENPAEVTRMMKLSPIPLALELATLAHTIAQAPAPAPRPTSQAPEPIQRIRTTARAEVRPENMESDEFQRWWNKRTKGRE